MVTPEQSIVPSSGSVTVTENGTVSPKLTSCPFAGEVIVTVGAVLPTPIWTFAVPVAPCGSVTVSVTA
jgi:hypothetical protein